MSKYVIGSKVWLRDHPEYGYGRIIDINDHTDVTMVAYKIEFKPKVIIATQGQVEPLHFET